MNYIPVTPCDSQTLSKRAEAFLRPWYPRMASGGRRSKMVADGREYFDLNGALGAVTLGYGTLDALKSFGMYFGASFSLPTIWETRAAKIFVDHSPWIEQVRFVKTGSEANESALRIARLATGRSQVMKFLGHYHGWHAQLQTGAAFQGGIPEGFRKHTAMRDMEWIDGVGLEEDLATEQFAAVILEPAQFVWNEAIMRRLLRLQTLCHQYGTVLIFDEILTGFRFDRFGISQLSGIYPDIATYGKCLAQGFALAAVCGRKELMEHAWTTSGTFGGECLSLQVFCSLYEFYTRHKVCPILWEVGKELTAFLLANFPGLCVEGSGPRLRLSYPYETTPRRWYSFLVGCIRNHLFMHPAGINIMFSHQEVIEEIKMQFLEVAEFLEAGGLTDKEYGDTLGPEPAWRDR